MSDLIERIYEAAFVPERWNSVLQEASDLSGSASAQIFFFSEHGPPRGTTLENLRPLFDKFIKGDTWKFCDSAQKMCAVQPASFVRVDDFMTAEEIARDPARIMLREFGIGEHLWHFLNNADTIFGIGCSFTRTSFGTAMPKGKKMLHLTLDAADVNKDIAF